MYYDLKAYDKNWRVKPIACRYVANNTLAVTLVTEEGEPFANITVNITDSIIFANEAAAFVDTNNCPWAEDFLRETDLGSPVGIFGRSGYCEYPLYKFAVEKMEHCDSC